MEYKYIVLILVGIFLPLSTSIETVYFNQACNTTRKSITTNLRLEPGPYLWYYGSTNCFYNVVAPTGNIVQLNIRMFDLEPPARGSCVDYINIHDGSDISAPVLNSSPLCDDLIDLPNRTFLSTGNEMTVYLFSDRTGEGRGFNFIFSVASLAPCSSSEFNCVNTSICIDSSLTCNAIHECGGSSDETGCTYQQLQEIRLNPHYGLIIGLLIGIPAGIILIALVVVKLWRYHQWRLYTRRPLTAKYELEPTTYQTAYPVTRLYYKEEYHGLYENPTIKKAQIVHKQRKQEQLEAEARAAQLAEKEIQQQENNNTNLATDNPGFEHGETTPESQRQEAPNSPETPDTHPFGIREDEADSANIGSGENRSAKFGKDGNRSALSSNGEKRKRKFKNKFFESEKAHATSTTKQVKPKQWPGKANRK